MLACGKSLWLGFPLYLAENPFVLIFSAAKHKDGGRKEDRTILPCIFPSIFLFLTFFPWLTSCDLCVRVFFFFWENRRRRLMRASTTGLPSSWRAASTHLGTRPCSNLSEARKVCFIFWVFFSYLWRWFEIRRLLIFWNFWCVYSLIIWFWTDGKLIHGRKIDPHFQQLSTTEEIWDRVLCHACKGWRSPFQWK